MIERIFYGMVNGKITMDKTPGVNTLLSDKSIEYIRNLGVEASDRYLYFKQEQVIAYPKIIPVFDEDSKRSWVQNETRLMSVHDFLEASNVGKILWQNQQFIEIKELPDQFNSLTV